MSDQILVYAVILGLGFLAGYWCSPKRRVLSAIGGVHASLQDMSNHLDGVAKHNYVSGFSNCAKYVARTHGQQMTEAQLTDVLNEVKRVCNTNGVKL